MKCNDRKIEKEGGVGKGESRHGKREERRGGESRVRILASGTVDSRASTAGNHNNTTTYVSTKSLAR